MLNEEYIRKKDKKYLIEREFGGIEYFFGEFLTLDEAISKIKWLNAHGWPVSQDIFEKANLLHSSDERDLSNSKFYDSCKEIDNVYDPSEFDCNILNNSYENDILNIAQTIQFVEEDPKIPFPQSDDLNRLIFIGQHLLEKGMNKEEIKRLNQIGDRIVNMYTSTGFYFHIFEKYKENRKIFYRLSSKGKDIFSSDEYDRNLKICRCILEHEILHKIFMRCLLNKTISKEDIINIMLQYDLNLNSMVTIKRRAQCISSWMHWIFRLMDIEI